MPITVSSLVWFTPSAERDKGQKRPHNSPYSITMLASITVPSSSVLSLGLRLHKDLQFTADLLFELIVI